MFGTSSKVLPLPDPESTDIGTLSNNLKYSHLENIAVIRIEGMGTDSPAFCGKKIVKQVYFENISYESNGLLNDAFQLLSDTRNLSHEQREFNVKCRKSQLRLFNLIQVIIKYLKNHDIHKVVVIGISHGSLLVHAAIIKIQMEMDADLYEKMAKLRIYTIGSPRYLPKNLLAGDQQILNFYHVKDIVINAVQLITPVIHSFKVPNLMEAAKRLTRNKKIYEYDSKNAIVYVNKETFIDVFDLGSIRGIYYKAYANYYMPISIKVSKKIGHALFHAYPFILYPIMDVEMMYNITYMTLAEIGSLLPCDMLVVNGGKPKKYIKYQNKTYLIRDKNMGRYILTNGIKTYIKDIKGKYRYIAK